jgi:hypothetical protein
MHPLQQFVGLPPVTMHYLQRKILFHLLKVQIPLPIYIPPQHPHLTLTIQLASLRLSHP